MDGRSRALQPAVRRTAEHGPPRAGSSAGQEHTVPAESRLGQGPGGGAAEQEGKSSPEPPGPTRLPSDDRQRLP
eukprot:3883127-Rhodomonas_salina.1